METGNMACDWRLRQIEREEMILSLPLQWIRFQIEPLMDAVDEFATCFSDRLIEDLLGFKCVKFEADTLRFDEVFMFTTKGGPNMGKPVNGSTNL